MQWTPAINVDTLGFALAPPLVFHDLSTHQQRRMKPGTIQFSALMGGAICCVGHTSFSPFAPRLAIVVAFQAHSIPQNLECMLTGTFGIFVFFLSMATSIPEFASLACKV